MKLPQKPPKHQPPSYLRESTREWWQRVVNEYDLQEHHRMLLTKAAESHDRGDQARDILDKQGLTFLDRFKTPRARPEVAIERDCKIAFARLMRELCLDISVPETRMPSLA